MPSKSILMVAGGLASGFDSSCGAFAEGAAGAGFSVSGVVAFDGSLSCLLISFVGDFAHLAVRRVPNANCRETIGVVVVTESQIISTRRPGVVANLTVRSVRNFNQLAIGERDHV